MEDLTSFYFCRFLSYFPSHRQNSSYLISQSISNLGNESQDKHDFSLPNQQKSEIHSLVTHIVRLYIYDKKSHCNCRCGKCLSQRLH